MPARRYTEDQFRAALDDPDVRTMADLCRAVGIVPRGANYESLRAYAVALELEIDRVFGFRQLGRCETTVVAEAARSASMGELLGRLGLPDRSGLRAKLRKLLGELAPDGSPLPLRRDGSRARASYSDEALLAAVEDADDYRELCRMLGLRPLSNTYRRLRQHATDLGIVIPEEWSRPGPIGASLTVEASDGAPGPAGRIEYEEAEARRAVAAASCRADAIRALGDEPTGTTYERLQRAIVRHRIDIEHLSGPTSRGGRTRRSLDELLVRGRRCNSSRLRSRLIEAGLKEARCETCGRDWWQGAPIPLELDHIDGDRTNNLLSNLRLLCPNCHALTPTFRSRNRGRR